MGASGGEGVRRRIVPPRFRPKRHAAWLSIGPLTLTASALNIKGTPHSPVLSRRANALLEEVGLVAGKEPSAFLRRAAETSKALAAVAGLLKKFAAVLRELAHVLHEIGRVVRELVRVLGWLAVLYGTFMLLTQPHLSSQHLITPGAGALAVLQGSVKPKRGKRP